jgi:hypothetical protein
VEEADEDGREDISLLSSSSDVNEALAWMKEDDGVEEEAPDS